MIYHWIIDIFAVIKMIKNRRIMKENFQIHIWLGLLLCLLGMSCSDDTPAKGNEPGNGQHGVGSQ